MSAPAPISNPRPVVSVPVSQTGSNNRISSQLARTSTPGGATDTTQIVSETRQLVTSLRGGQSIIIPFSGISYYFEFVGTLGGISNNFRGLRVRAMNAGHPRSDLIHVQGTGLRFGTLVFNGIEVVNLDPVNSVLFTIDVGGGIPNNSYDEYLDKRVIIAAGTGSVTVTTSAGVNLNVQNGVTFAVGFTTRNAGWADLLAAGATQAVADGYLAKARKSIIFANDDAVAVLTVFDVGGNILGSIQPGTSWTTDTGGTIQLHNPSGGNVVCHIGEIYYS